MEIWNKYDNIKKCSKCNIEKNLSEFSRSKKIAGRSQCKVCDKHYRNLKKEEIAEYLKRYRDIEKNKEKNKLYCREYRINKKEEISIKRKNKRGITKNQIKIASKKYYEKNKTLLNKKSKNYTIKNRLKINEKARIRKYERRKVDVLYKLTCNIRRLISISFKNKSVNKNTKTFDILGCTNNKFKEHIETLFEEWMTWENKGKYNGNINYGWDLDHIIPISSAKTKEDIIKLNHFTNFQPLCSYNNRCIKKNN